MSVDPNLFLAFWLLKGFRCPLQVATSYFNSTPPDVKNIFSGNFDGQLREAKTDNMYRANEGIPQPNI